MIEIHIETIQQVTVVKLTGEIDTSMVSMVQEKIFPLCQPGCNIIVDMTHVAYMSGASLRLLVSIDCQIMRNRGRMVLVGLSEVLKDTIAVTGFNKPSFTVCESLEDALQTFGPAVPLASAIPTEVVRFTAFHPKEAAAEKWYTLLVYAFVKSALEAVYQDALYFKDEMGVLKESITQLPGKLARGTELTIVPTGERITFNPERFSFKWVEDFHRASFRFRADKSLIGDAGRVIITIYVGPLIVGTLKLAMLINETTLAVSPRERSQQISGQMYKPEAVFVSYSHSDTPVVVACRDVYKALGFDVLIDIDTLRSGQRWNHELMRLIDQADIFQLFWSKNSVQSNNVRQEWQHAVKCDKGEGFIRPVYWEKPMPPRPPELESIHFAYMDWWGLPNKVMEPMR